MNFVINGNTTQKFVELKLLKLFIPSISNYMLDNFIDPLREPLKYFEIHLSIARERKGFGASFTFKDISSSEFIEFSKTLGVKQAS